MPAGRLCRGQWASSKMKVELEVYRSTNAHPEVAKLNTSRLVKSGGVKTSFSKSLLHGRRGIFEGAMFTSFSKALVRSLFTTAIR